MINLQVNPDTHCINCGNEYGIADELCEECGFDQAHNELDFARYQAAEKLYNESKVEKKRIYDDSNHPHYGPVRRLWVILAQLDLLKYDSELTAKFDGMNWDQRLSQELTERSYLTEAQAQCGLLHFILNEI